MDQDVRWKQRYSNYAKALLELKSAVELSKARELTKLEKRGIIQCFKYTHDLSWKTLKDFLENQGTIELFGSRDTVREAFKLGILSDGEVWMQMIKNRNLTSHIYDEKVVDEIAKLIIDVYFSRFQELNNTFCRLQEERKV